MYKTHEHYLPYIKGKMDAQDMLFFNKINYIDIDKIINAYINMYPDDVEYTLGIIYILENA